MRKSNNGSAMQETASLTRAILSDDEAHFVQDALHWIWSWQLSWERFLKSWNTDSDQRTMESVELQKRESHIRV